MARSTLGTQLLLAGLAVVASACQEAFDQSESAQPPVLEPEPLRFCEYQRTAGGKPRERPPVFDGARAIRPPSLGSVVEPALEDAPPPVSGGTLLATRDGNWVVASDPDRDQLYVVSVQRRALERVLKLDHRAEPGRLAEDASGRIHVVLRGGKGIVTTTLAAGELAERPVCDLPRGIAYDAAGDELHVACAEGKLVTLGADPGSPVRRVLDLGRDLRDVIVHDGKLFVSRFRAAEMLQISRRSGAIVGLYKPPRFVSAESPSAPLPEPSDACLEPPEQYISKGNTFSPTVAWRIVDMPGVGIAMLHQQASEGVLKVTPGGYSDVNLLCGQAPARSALTLLAGPPGYGGPLYGAMLATDVAVSPNGARLAFVSSGHLIGGSVSVLHNPMIGVSEDGGCVGSTLTGVPNTRESERYTLGQVTAAAFVSDELLAIQVREPAEIIFARSSDGSITERVNLAQASRYDFGHAAFHTITMAGVACAHCHAEAMDDGHLWEFVGIGLRRTQSLRGGILGSEPFHWNGDMADFDHLVDDVFSGRMLGFSMEPAEKAALAAWIDRQPALRVSARERADAERGRKLFASSAVGCAECHSGPRFTNNETVDVGTGAALQVPSLRNVSFRTPLMHDGCARTLRDRFGPCGGGDSHGRTSQLSTAQVDDLIAYLETL